MAQIFKINSDWFIFPQGFLLLLLLFLTACEQNINLEIPEGNPKIVVEGYIEPNQNPVVVLTKSAPVFRDLSAAALEADFVHNAKIFVVTNGREYELQEINSNQLGQDRLAEIAGQFGLALDQVTRKLPFTFYFYSTAGLIGVPGNNYRLRIVSNAEILTASTSIPHLNPLDSLWFKPHPDQKNDSLVTLWYRYRDPDTLGNCVRYFTRSNREAFYPGYFSSVFIDEFVNGQPYIDFPLLRGEPKFKEIDVKTFGYFKKGDTVTIKWSAIDMAQYRFWNSLETEFNSQGNPVGSPTILQTNIQGGLGIWGGYGSMYHTIIAPE